VGVDDTGAFRSDGNTITRLVRAGETVPGSSDTFETIFPKLASNLSGQVAIHASIAFDPISGPSGEDGDRIYVHNGAVLEEVARTGVSIPDGNGTLASISFENIGIANNGNVLFLGNVQHSDSSLLDGDFFFLTDGQTFTQIALQGEFGPGEQEFVFVAFPGIDSNNQDKVAFSASLHRNAAPPDNVSSGIYMGDGNSTTLLVHQGDAVPGGNGVFGSVAVALFLNNNGEIVFSASLEGTADPANDFKGIFFIGSDRSIHTVARYGMPLAGSTIRFADFTGTFVPFGLDNSDLNLAGMNSINDSGQVAFKALLADGRLGLFLWQASDVPPPDDDTIFADGFE
jgi:hypothetical protein